MQKQAFMEESDQSLWQLCAQGFPERPGGVPWTRGGDGRWAGKMPEEK